MSARSLFFTDFSMKLMLVRLIAVIIIPLAAIGLFGILYGRSTLHDLAVRNAQSINAMKARLISEMLSDRASEVAGIARSPKFSEIVVIALSPH
jgi:hypothetical protein